MIERGGKRKNYKAYLWGRANFEVLGIEANSIYTELVAVETAGSGFDEFKEVQAKHYSPCF